MPRRGRCWQESADLTNGCHSTAWGGVTVFRAVSGAVKKHPRAFTAFGASTIVAVFLVVSLSGTSISAATVSAIEQSVAGYADARLAVYSPIAVDAQQSTFCLSTSCGAPSASVATSVGSALAQLSDVEVTSPSMVNWLSLAVGGVRLDEAVMQQRDQLALSAFGAPSAINASLQAAEELAQQEQALVNGAYGSCNVSISCSITAAAGASIVSYSNVSVSGNSATVSAIVNDWQQQAPVNQSGAIGPWSVAQGEMQMTYSLAMQPDGTWLVTAEAGTYLPGQGP